MNRTFPEIVKSWCCSEIPVYSFSLGLQIILIMFFGVMNNSLSIFQKINFMFLIFLIDFVLFGRLMWKK